MSIQDDIYAVFEEQSKALVNYMREYVELAKVWFFILLILGMLDNRRKI